MKVTLLEYMNENGIYVFFGVYSTRNPENAVGNYLKEHGLDEEGIKIEEDDGEFFVEDVCRAFEVEVK